MPDFDVLTLSESRKRKSRSHGIRKKGNDKRKRCAALKLNISLNDLAVKLRIHGRHPMLSYLGSLPIAALRSLDTDANRFYDRNQMYDAALLTRCYNHHALRPFIDCESNHIRSFIKIPFINKGIDFIDLPSIFQDKSVIQSIPTYFQNSEPPIICYKYNKPIRNTIFNFNKLVSDLDIHANTPMSQGFRATSLSTYDFSTLYTTLPHNLIKEKLLDLIEWTFKRALKLWFALFGM